MELEILMAWKRLGEAPPSTAARGVVQKMRTVMLRLEEVVTLEAERSKMNWKRGVMRVTSPTKERKISRGSRTTESRDETRRHTWLSNRPDHHQLLRSPFPRLNIPDNTLCDRKSEGNAASSSDDEDG